MRLFFFQSENTPNGSPGMHYPETSLNEAQDTQLVTTIVSNNDLWAEHTLKGSFVVEFSHREALETLKDMLEWQNGVLSGKIELGKFGVNGWEGNSDAVLNSIFSSSRRRELTGTPCSELLAPRILTKNDNQGGNCGNESSDLTECTFTCLSGWIPSPCLPIICNNGVWDPAGYTCVVRRYSPTPNRARTSSQMSVAKCIRTYSGVWRVVGRKLAWILPLTISCSARSASPMGFYLFRR